MKYILYQILITGTIYILNNSRGYIQNSNLFFTCNHCYKNPILQGHMLFHQDYEFLVCRQRKMWHQDFSWKEHAGGEKREIINNLQLFSLKIREVMRYIFSGHIRSCFYSKVAITPVYFFFIATLSHKKILLISLYKSSASKKSV